MHEILQEFALSFSDAVFWILGVGCLSAGFFEFIRESENNFVKLLSKYDTKYHMQPTEYAYFIGGILLAVGVWCILAFINGYVNLIWLSIILAIYLILIPVIASFVLCFLKNRAKRMRGDSK